MQFEKWFDLDLDKGHALSVDLGPVLFTEDSNPLKLGIRLFSNGEAVDVDGTVSGKAVIPDGSTIAPLEAGSANNAAWIVIPQTALALQGKIEMFLRISDASAGAVALYATATIHRSETDTVYVPGDPLPDVDELRQIAEDCETATAAAQAYKNLVDTSAHTSVLTLGRENRMNNNYSDTFRNVTIGISNGTVSLSGTASGAIRLKLSNTAEVNSSVQSAWRSENLGLVDGHRYALLCHTLKGSYSSGKLQVGFYDNGSGSLCWVDVPAAGSVAMLSTTSTLPEFTYDSSGTHPTCVVAYMQGSCKTATGGIVFQVELVDLTAYAQGRDAILNGYGAYRDKTAQTLGRIDLTDGIDAAMTLSGIAIKRTGNVITLDGTATTGLRIKLSGALAANAAVQSAWRAETPALVEGRTYKIVAMVLGGTRTSGTVSAAFYDSDSSYGAEAVLFSTSGAYAPVEVNEPRYSAAVRWDGDNLRALCIYISSGAVLSNLTLMVDVLDVEAEDGAELPAYYFANDYMAERIEAILAARTANSINGVELLWFTDPHYFRISALGKLMAPENGMQSGKLAAYIRKRTNCRTVICGGDVLRGNSITHAKALELFGDVRTLLDPIYADLWMTLGNHEYNNINSSNASNQMTSAEVYAALCKHQEIAMDSVSSKGDYTIVDKAQDTRFFILGCDKDAAVFADSVTWLAAKLQAATEAHIIIVSHVGLKTPTSPAIDDGFTAVASLIDAYNGRTSPFQSATGEIVCALTGHGHWDGVKTTTGGTPIIATTCDRAFIGDDGDEGTREVRKIGTIGEQALDYVLIDYTARTIDLIRIGGSILGASYDSNTGKIYDTDVGTGTEYTGEEWVAASTHKDRHYTF